MARHNPAEIVTGAVVLAAAGAFLLFAVANTGKSFGASGYSLHASFDHADGIAPGVKIGSIEAVSLDPKTYQADVTFSVQNDIKLTDDSSATVSTDGLLGGKYLALAVGGDDKILKAGDAITITQGSMNLEGLISKYIFPSVGGKGGGGKGGSGGAGNSGQAASSGGGIAPLK
jgi:phospholipid/cholesterol/gamma-HCH transport system substrate-binding protein